MIKKLIDFILGRKDDLVIPDYYIKVEEQVEVVRDSNNLTIKAKLSDVIVEPIEDELIEDEPIEEQIIIDESVSESKKPIIELKNSTHVIVDNRKEYSIKADPPKPIVKKVPEMIIPKNVPSKDFSKINEERLAKIDKLTTIIAQKRMKRYLDLMSHK